MSLKLPIYRRDVNDRTTNLVDQMSLRNIHEHDHEGLGREPMNKMNEPSSPSKRHARFELDLAANIESACCAQNTIHNVKHSSQLREKKLRDLSSSLDRRQRQQAQVEQALLIKRRFQEKYEALQQRVWNGRAKHLVQLSLVIIKAYTQKRKEEKREAELASFVQQRLRLFKTRRLFRGMKSFGDWQKAWVENVKSNFRKQKLKSAFRDIYLNVILQKLRLKFIQNKLFKILRAIKQDAQHQKDLHRQLKASRRHRLRLACFQALRAHRKREQDLLRKGLMLAQRRKYWLELRAVSNWKLFTKKVKEYKQDDITKQFIQLDNAIILADQPGQPLVVMESDDSCRYFDVNARILSSCQNMGDYAEMDYRGQIRGEGSVVKRRSNTFINLDKYV